MIKVVIIGGRGNGTVIASTIEDCRKAGQDIMCAGFLNDNEAEVNGYPVLGGIQDNSWDKLPKDHYFIYAMSNVKQAEERYNLLNKLNIPYHRYCNVIHPSAVVSDQAKLGVGIALMPFTVISPNVVIGNHSQMYAQSFIGHDSIIDEMVFVANNASIGGRIHIHNGAHVGSNCSILERLELGPFSITGIGSVVTKSVEPYAIVVGSPARTIRYVNAN